jgi:FkbM family methyltransferase
MDIDAPCKRMTSVRRLSLLALCVLILASAVLVYAARSDRYASYWADARSAYNWENRFCTRLAAFHGLVKARTVTARTAEIQRASRYVGEVDGLYLYQTPMGNFWMPQPDDLWSLAVVLAEQENEMYGGADGLGVRPGDVVIDGGAHVGLFTRTALALGASKVITFEVAPNAVRAQRKNLEKEIADGRVIVVGKGVWFEEGTLPLTVVERCSVCNSVTHKNMQAAFDVPLTTIDKAMEELKVERVDFIKLDIENAEANALRGAQYTIKKDRPRVAVALENHKMRIAYGYEVLGLMRDLFPGYEYVCGACTNPEKTARVLPEILHFYPSP